MYPHTIATNTYTIVILFVDFFDLKKIIIFFHFFSPKLFEAFLFPKKACLLPKYPQMRTTGFGEAQHL